MTRSAPMVLLWLSFTGALLLASTTAAFAPAARTSMKAFQSSSSSLTAYLDTTVESAASAAVPSSGVVSPSSVASKSKMDPSAVGETVQLGTLQVPQVGVGTIAWSADKGAYEKVCIDLLACLL